MSPTAQGNNGCRLRRAKSVTCAEDMRKTEETLRKAQPDRPCHRYQDSLFSWSSGFGDFTGFVNWAFILLFMGGFRLLLENLLKYGIRIDPTQWIILLCGGDGGEHNVSLLLLAYSCIPICTALLIEDALAKNYCEERTGLRLQIVNCLFVIFLPMVVITTFSEQFSLIGASVVCFTYSIIFLKLWSYIQVNMWCRRNLQNYTKAHLKHTTSFCAKFGNGDCKTPSSGSVADVSSNLTNYPDNLTLADMAYFMFIPTLCYELNFPRTDRVRKRFLFKRMLELIIGIQVIAALFQQWMIPSVKHALIPFTNMDFLKATERLLKLSIPNHLMWLIIFYLLFHSLLNFMGELLHFADRNFYNDWWNANNSNIFWRKWNTLVHRWAVRHVYIPMVEMGYSKMYASITVFFISAFFHEFLVSIPLRTFKSWAFIGMMMQIPLSNLSTFMERKYGPRWGNIIVWLSLILGQPLCIMMYYHDYVISHYGVALLEQFGHL